jgi:hypothetical protein
MQGSDPWLPIRLTGLWDIVKVSKQRLEHPAGKGAAAAAGRGTRQPPPAAPRQPNASAKGQEPEDVWHKIEATWELDIANVRKLTKEVDLSEEKFYAFISFYKDLAEVPAEVPTGADVNTVPDTPDSNDDQDGAAAPSATYLKKSDRKMSLGNNKELGRVFNYLIRIRKLQKEMEDILPLSMDIDDDAISEEITEEEMADITSYSTADDVPVQLPPTGT